MGRPYGTAKVPERISASVSQMQRDHIEERIRDGAETLSGVVRNMIQDSIEMDQTIASGGIVIQLPRSDRQSLQNLVDVGLHLSIADGIRSAVKNYITASRNELDRRREALRRIE